MFLTARRLFATILFFALFVMAAREIADPDFWWHLRTGQFIVETRTIPHADIFSFTNAGRPWVTHEWLSEVLMYALYALGSFPALILAFAAVIALTFACVYARCPGRPYVAAFALLLAALAAAPTWGARPQMFSLLLTSIFLYVLDKRRNWSGTLPPLMLLWVNLHSGYALGLVIIAVFLFGEIISDIQSRTILRPFAKLRAGFCSGQAPHASRSTSPLLPRAPAPQRALAGVVILSFAAVLLNPNGATMFVYPFETLTSPTMQAYIQEWFSPDFHQVEFQPFAWLLLGTLAALAFAGKRVSLTQTILLAGFGYAALRSARNIPIFAIIAAPVLAEQLWRLVEARLASTIFVTNKRMTRGMAILNWVVLLIIVAAGAARVAMVAANQNAVERAKYPAAAVDFLQARRGEVTSPLMYNAYGWGGYLIWRLYPETRVFIDGRADVYGDAFIENVYLKAYRGGIDWRAPLDQHNVRVVLVEPGAPLAVQLARDAAWKKAYEDGQAVIFDRQQVPGK
jgi:hypothetical protein